MSLLLAFRPPKATLEFCRRALLCSSAESKKNIYININIYILYDATICVHYARICSAAQQTAIYDSATEEKLTDEKWTR
jgi:hypothetical protein